MKKTVFALLLCICMFLSLAGCKDTNPTGNPDGAGSDISVQDTDGYSQVEESSLEFGTALYNAAKLQRGYESLETDAERMCYRLLELSVFYISDEEENGKHKVLPVTVEGEVLTEAQLHLVITAFTLDHPEVFWIENEFSYYTTSDSISLQLVSALSCDEVVSAAQEMGEVLDEVFEGLPGNLSQYDRELYIHDVLVDKCTYAKDIHEGKGDFSYFTSYGAIVREKAVCEGYSRAMQLMLSLVGVESYCVSGYGVDELHMWNVVNLGGNWYYLDATWNDTDNSSNSYEHFNLTTEQLLADHRISPLYSDATEAEICGDEDTAPLKFNLFVPECTDEDMTYYVRNAVAVKDFESESLDMIADAMVDAALSEAESVNLYIDPDCLDFDEAVDNLFYAGDYAIFTCIERANTILSGVRIKDDYISTTDSPTHYVVTVYLEYETVE